MSYLTYKYKPLEVYLMSVAGEAKPPEPTEEFPPLTERELSALGIFSFEEAMRRGEEIRGLLQRLLEEIESSGLLRDDIRINISLDEGLKVVIFPRFPITLRHEDIQAVEVTRTPQPLEKVTARSQLSADNRLELLMIGRVVEANELRAEFDPLAPHDILVCEQGLPPGAKHESGLRLTSHLEDGISVLDFEIH